ncbi:hypothetical protein EIP91_002908 [Steccherinum ochraceum]|uniref:Uncharacterized protein n=1 Tax=Steccherinum ochraceum TaxID=92696 RepID=A0A4R0RTJ0_9APHY|nr:hypothetical protein EIP91_002908 [Steccherinum ochraceum]
MKKGFRPNVALHDKSRKPVVGVDTNDALMNDLVVHAEYSELSAFALLCKNAFDAEFAVSLVAGSDPYASKVVVAYEADKLDEATVARFCTDVLGILGATKNIGADDEKLSLSKQALWSLIVSHGLKRLQYLLTKDGKAKSFDELSTLLRGSADEEENRRVEIFFQGLSTIFTILRTLQNAVFPVDLTPLVEALNALDDRDSSMRYLNGWSPSDDVFVPDSLFTSVRTWLYDMVLLADKSIRVLIASNKQVFSGKIAVEVATQTATKPRVNCRNPNDCLELYRRSVERKIGEDERSEALVLHAKKHWRELGGDDDQTTTTHCDCALFLHLLRSRATPLAGEEAIVMGMSSSPCFGTTVNKVKVRYIKAPDHWDTRPWVMPVLAESVEAFGEEVLQKVQNNMTTYYEVALLNLCDWAPPEEKRIVRAEK